MYTHKPLSSSIISILCLKLLEHLGLSSKAVLGLAAGYAQRKGKGNSLAHTKERDNPNCIISIPHHIPSRPHHTPSHHIPSVLCSCLHAGIGHPLEDSCLAAEEHQQFHSQAKVYKAKCLQSLPTKCTLQLIPWEFPWPRKVFVKEELVATIYSTSLYIHNHVLNIYIIHDHSVSKIL